MRNNNLSKTTIFYFSGTGNSLYVAQRLQERLVGAVIQPIVEFARKSTIDNAQKSIELENKELEQRLKKMSAFDLLNLMNSDFA